MEEMLAFVGGALLLALVISLALTAIVAVGWFLFVVVLPIVIIIGVGYFVYQSAKTHLACQGRDISEFIPALPKWRDLPPEFRDLGGYAGAAIAGTIGLALPGIISAGGSAINAIGVIATLLIFSWAMPLGFHKVLNSSSIRNEVRFPLLALMGGYAFSVSLVIHPLVFLFVCALTAGYAWWWYEHHPYLKMRVAHARCEDLHRSTKLLSTEDFLKDLRTQYTAKWGFEPSAATMQVAEDLYRADATQDLAPLPDLPPFKPAYAPGEDITYRLAQLEAALREIPVKTNHLTTGIADALNAYTAAIPRPHSPSVFTVAAREMVADLPALVHALGISFPNGFAARSGYERHRDAISRDGLGVKAYESGERIDPEAYANA